MADSKRKAPKLRFPGFSDDWEQRKLGDTAIILAGGDVDKSKIKEIGKYPVLANALTNEGIVGYYNDYFRIEAPAVTVTGRGDVGHAQARKFNFTPIVRLLSVKSEHDVDFLANAINNHKILVESTGVPQLTAPQLGNYQIYFPTKEEETRIGSFFKQLDNLITLHQRKLSDVQKLKSGLLQKMFPKNGGKVPEIRFPEFSDDWEQRELGDLVVWSKGNKLAKNVLNQSKDGDEVIHYADLYKFSAVVNDVIHWSQSGEGTAIPDNSLLFPMSDVTPFGLARTSTITKREVRAGSDILIGTLINANASFVSYQVNAHSQKILPLVTGTTVKHISSRALSKLDITIPQNFEQEKIGLFFQQLDNLITLHQRKLEHLQQQKKALLQQMFI